MYTAATKSEKLAVRLITTMMSKTVINSVGRGHAGACVIGDMYESALLAD